MDRRTFAVDSPGYTSPAHIECLSLGSGLPVTVFAHGLGGGIDDTRPLASGVEGTRVFMHARSHGQSTPALPDVSYDDLATDLLAVADAVDATGVLGVSLGAATLVRVLAAEPDRFDNIVFYLPPVLDGVRHVTPMSGALLESGTPDLQRLTDLILDEVPASLRDSPQVVRWARTRADRLLVPGIDDLLRIVLSSPPVESPDALSGVRARCQIIGAYGDEAHPAEVSIALAAAIAGSAVEVFDQPGPLWNERSRVRALVSRGLVRT